MKSRILRYLKHLALTLAVLLPCLILFGLSQGATLNYGAHEHFMNWPHSTSEGLLIEQGNYYRLREDGGKTNLN